jgi:ABC-type transporter Mla subunit MlaD
VVLLLAAVALGLLITQGGGHRVVLVTAKAEDVIPGLSVRAAGRPVGHIAEAVITRDHRARLVLELDDDVWPLPVDSRLQLRFGGTIKYTDRYLELRRGRSRSTVRDGGLLPTGAFTAPAEFDELFDRFDPPVRNDLRSVLDRGGPALQAARATLPAALDDAPPAFDEVRAVFDDIGGDSRTLDALTRSSDRVVAAIRRADPGVGRLVSGAAVTFHTVARESRALQTALTETPGALQATRALLDRAGGTLTRLGTFSQEAAPGVHRLRQAAGPLTGFLDRAIRVGPAAEQTLRTARSLGPDLDPFLDRARALMPDLESIGRQGASQLRCIRPYAPDIAGFFSTWGPGAWGDSDGTDTYLRAEFGPVAFPNAVPFDSATVTRLYPQIKMAFPRPPGDIAGQPHFVPACGIDASAYDAAADPETVP